jgi:SEC-C motif-containing protein
MDHCPCGSGSNFSVCCEPFITSAAYAPTAEQLMRSRYTAYAKGAIQYILETTLEEKRKECDEKAIRDWSLKSKWHNLEIIKTEKGTSEDNEGSVEFIAHFTENDVQKSLHEKGIFKKLQDKWFYVDGEIQKSKPFIRAEDKVSRNDPCPCGSGKKYKKCCFKE